MTSNLHAQLVRQGFDQTTDTLETMETTMSGSKKLQTTPEFFDIGTWPRDLDSDGFNAAIAKAVHDASLAHEMVHVMADLVSEARWRGQCPTASCRQALPAPSKPQPPTSKTNPSTNQPHQGPHHTGETPFPEPPEESHD